MSKIIRFALGTVLCISVGGCESEMVPYEYELNESLSSYSIPADVGAAIARLDTILPDEAKAALKECNNAEIAELCKEFNAKFKLPLQRAISNEWMRPKESELARHYTLHNITNPESMASALLSEFVNQL